MSSTTTSTTATSDSSTPTSGSSTSSTTTSSSSPTTTTPPETTNESSTSVSSTTSTPSTTSLSSSSSSSTTTSATAPILTPTTSPTTSLSTSSSHIVTITSQVTYTPTPSTTGISGGANGGNKGFFDNKGAVAGVFTVVGLVGLGLIIALVTNIIRRRRAKEFDREIAEAAEEAAKAPAPAFLDDEDDNYRPGVAGGGYGRRGDFDDYPHGGGYGGGGPYSDVSSHGTYSQPPMTTTGESYNMHDMGGHHGGGAPGELYNPYPAAAVAGAAGAAGVGVARARSTRDPNNFAAGFTEGASPYAAFAGPGFSQQQGYGNYNANGAYGAAGGYQHGPGSPEYDILDAAGMNGNNPGTGTGAAASGAAGVAGVQRGMSLNHQPESQLPYNGPGPQRSHSAGNRSAESGYSASVYTTPSANYPSGAGGTGSAPPMPHQESYGSNYAADPEDPYGGYADDQHSRSGHGHGQHIVGNADSDGEDEAHRGPRVLRVANE